MNTDVRAMRPHDLISVVVTENLAASTDGSVKNSRQSSANSQISSLISKLHAGNALQNLVNQSSAADLNAQGTTATNSSLSTVFGGQVVDVLPNGMLVIEAARQVEFSQQTQTLSSAASCAQRTSRSRIRSSPPPSPASNSKSAGRESSPTTPAVPTSSSAFCNSC